MKPRSREKFKGRKSNGYFFRMPTEILDCPAYIGLSFKARVLLFDMGAQFRGANNGDIAAPWSWIQTRGWNSKDTLKKARDELLASGLIEQTRQGGLHCATLFAFTWLAIDECGGKLDVPSTAVASNKWRRSHAVAGP